VRVPRIPSLRAVRHLFSPLRPDDYLDRADQPPVDEGAAQGGQDRTCRRGRGTVVIRSSDEWAGNRAGQDVRLGVIIVGVYHWRAS
jgi:stearoyl-CoA 9-desaturase NADPH oxidoreductase